MKRKRTLAILLVLTLLITCVPWTAAAAASTEEPVGTEAIAPTAEQPVVEETQLPLLEADTVPETMEYADAVAQNHILRLYGEEGNDLNRVVFLNRDGSRTMYLYDFPVKYVDSDGMIRDISLDIADSNTPLSKYETAANSTVTSFSEKLSDGISLSGNGVSMRLVPVQPVLQPGQSLTATADAVAQRIDSKTVEYRYDAKTTIEYSLTYTGFKEDIVVSEYTGQTEYHFFLYTGGLSLTQIDGSYFLTDEDGTIKASIGEIIVFTADERNNTFGQLEAEPIKDQDIYLLTIVLDADYLADPNTAYPIRIDPTLNIEVNIIHEEDGNGAIEDVTIFSNGTSNGQYTTSTVGLSQKGISRLLMRFPNFEGLGLDGVTVTYARVTPRDIMCEDAQMNMTCYPYTGPAWEEANAQWNDNQSWDETMGVSLMISYNHGLQQPTDHWYRFEITELVQKWVDGEADPELGIIFKADDAVENGNTLLYKTFGSYELYAYKPWFTMTYQCSISLSTYYLELDIGETQRVSLYLDHPVPATIRWETSNPRIATVNSIGGITAYACGRVTISVWIEENPALKATLIVDVKPSQTPTPGVPFNCVCMIKNASTGTYLTAASSTELTLSDKNEMDGKQLWYVVWNESGYTLYSLGIKDIESSGEAVLKGAGLNNSPTLVPENEEGTSWAIDNYNGYYYINNTTCHSETRISVNTLTGNVCCMESETEYARWDFETIETSAFNNYWDGGYKDQKETLYLKIYIDERVFANGIVQEDDFDLIDQWNGISSRVVIYGPQDTAPEGVDPFPVFFTGKDLGQTCGHTEVIVEGDITTQYNEDWEGVIISINTSPQGPLAEDWSNNLVRTTILHEFGHALKLAHPKQTENLAEVPDGRGGYISDSMVVSIMNHGAPGSSTNLCVEYPSWHDIINLINKWGE